MPTEGTTFDVQPYLDHAPLAWAVGLGVLVLIGLILWLAGNKLAKPGVVLAGFVLGGVAATSVALAWTMEPAAVDAATGDAATTEGTVSAVTAPVLGPWMIGLGIGGAIAGALLALLLYRLWIALMAAVVLAMVVPAATLIWTGPPTPAPPDGDNPDTASLASDEAEGPDDQSEEQLDALDSSVEKLKTAAAQAGQELLSDPKVAENLSGDTVADLSNPEIQEAAALRAQQLLDVIRQAWAEQMVELRAWWDALEPRQRQLATGGSIIGAAVGLLLGLILPKVAASLQTALVGSLLMFFPGRMLLGLYAGAAAWLPQTPRGVLLTLGLITLIGLLLQCALSRKKTDK